MTQSGENRWKMYVNYVCPMRFSHVADDDMWVVFGRYRCSTKVSMHFVMYENDNVNTLG